MRTTSPRPCLSAADRCARLGALIASLLASQAIMAAPLSEAPAAGGWSFSAGAAALSAPRFAGSDRQRYLVVPTFELAYGDSFFINPIQGIGLRARPLEGLTTSAALGLSLDARRAKDDVRLRGLGDVKERAALILKVDYAFAQSSVSAEVSSRLGQQRGSLLNFEFGQNVLATSKGQYTLGVNARLMDARYARTFFEVNAAQATASGLRRFDAGAGLQRAGVFGQVLYRVSEDWTALARLDLASLRGDAAASPIVRQQRQVNFVWAAQRPF